MDPVIIAACLGALLGAGIAAFSNFLQNRAEDRRLIKTLEAQEKRDKLQRDYEAKKDVYIKTSIMLAGYSQKHIQGISVITPEMAKEINEAVAVLPLVGAKEIGIEAGKIFPLFAVSLVGQSATIKQSYLAQETEIVSNVMHLMRKDLGM